jgi:RsiW-degrading membrane proteinase PrsW (M82 family)
MKVIPLIALAIAPCLAIILFTYYRDKYEKEPKGLLFLSFLLGVLSIIPAFFLELFLWDIPVINDSAFLKATIGTGYVEELCKLFFILILPYWRKAFNEPLDGIIYAVMVSMGFATTENIMYVVNGGWGVGVMRIFTAVPAHAMFAVVMGYFIGLAKFRHKHTVLFIFFGYFIAGLFHGLYDYFLFEQNIPGIWLGAFVSLIVGLIFSLRAIRTHRKQSKLQAEQIIIEEPGPPNPPLPIG